MRQEGKGNFKVLQLQAIRLKLLKSTYAWNITITYMCNVKVLIEQLHTIPNSKI